MALALLTCTSTFLPTASPLIRTTSVSRVQPAPLAAEGSPAVGTRRPDVFGGMSADEQATFLSQLERDCSAEGVSIGELERFRALLDAMSEDAPLWQVLDSGQVSDIPPCCVARS